MSDPNDVWQASNNGSNGTGNGNNSAATETNRDRDQEMDGRSPRRDRSRSPARNGTNGASEAGDRGRDVPVNQGNNLHVSGLARVIDERMLEDIFSKHGKVDKVEIMTDPHTKESRGFGFVRMVSGDEAAVAIEQLNQTVQEGKTMTVALARRGRARTPTPGRYHGVKIEGGPTRYGGGGGYQDRPYQPRSYDNRYSDRGPPRYDDRRYDDRRYDDRRGGDYGRDRYDERRYDDRRGDYGGGARGGDRYDDYRAPPAAAGGGDRYYYRSDRSGYSERRDDRRYEPQERPRY